MNTGSIESGSMPNKSSSGKKSGGISICETGLSVNYAKTEKAAGNRHQKREMYIIKFLIPTHGLADGLNKVIRCCLLDVLL